MSNSIRDAFPFILAPISFTQELPSICVNLLTDTISETGELEKAIVSVGISPSHSSYEALATMELHLTVFATDMKGTVLVNPVSWLLPQVMDLYRKKQQMEVCNSIVCSVK